MFENFLKYFEEDISIEEKGDAVDIFMKYFGGRSFGKGLFRVFEASELDRWKENIQSAYPSFGGEFRLFGYDWMGRCFGIDLRKNSEKTILMFEIGTDDILEIPCNFEEFLNLEIPFNAEACLAEKFFKKWNKYSKKEIEHNRCVGYKIPLFLGGKDKIKNLEDSDMEVYWTVISQIKNNL